MTFTYVYKKADNIRRTGTITAKSRDAVFAALHAQGIRPIRVTAPPPTILSRLGKRGVAIVALGLLTCGLAFRLVHEIWHVDAITRGILEPAFRHAVPGIEMTADHFAKLFEHPCERFLAWFAQPGLQIELPVPTDGLAENFMQGLADPIHRRAGDSVETETFRAVVAGMKDEARRFLRTGCTVDDYVEMLTRRQLQEAAYRNEKKHEYEILLLRGDTAAVRRFLESANAELRIMGMVPLPQVHMVKTR